jgi:hypothetical protein
MTSNFYTFALTDRRRMLADAGFARDDLRIWSHPDGRAIGEGVAAALTDEAFLRFLKINDAFTSADEAESEDAEIATNHPILTR